MAAFDQTATSGAGQERRRSSPLRLLALCHFTHLHEQRHAHVASQLPCKTATMACLWHLPVNGAMPHVAKALPVCLPPPHSNPPHGVHFCKRQMLACISGAMHTLQKSSTCGASGAPPLTMKRTLPGREARGEPLSIWWIWLWSWLAASGAPPCTHGPSVAGKQP